MANGYFFAYASGAGARSSRPDWFVQDPETEEWHLVGQRVLVSTNGLWLVAPVMSDPDPDTGEQTVITPGERSADYVILSPEDDGSASKKIEPVGHQGFA